MAADHLTALVGRERELAELSAIIGLDDDPAGGSALLGGDAGIGKTRLLTELVDRARTARWRVLVGHCLDLGDSAMPFQPFVEALTSLSGPEHTELVTQVPALGPLLATTGSPSGADRSGVLAAVTAGLDVLAESAPVLLVVEDAHWADASTRHLLQFALARRFTHPVSLLVSYRTDDLHRRHPLRAAVAEWSRLPRVRRLTLGPLDDQAVAAILHAHGAGLQSEEGAAAIIRRAGGNAFYAEELLDTGLTDESLPESLTELLLVRLDRLDEDARTVVEAVACGTGPVTDALLADVLDLGGRPLEHALRAAVDHKVLVARPEGYTFRHALLQEAVHDDLLPGRRRRHHTAFLTALARSPVPAAARQIALHAEAAGDRATAFSASLAAGVDAVRVGGHDEGAAHYLRALSLLDAAPKDTGVSELVIAAADALVDAGHLRRATQLLREHLTTLPAEPSIERARLLIALGNACYYADADDDALEASAAALEAVPESASELQAAAEALRARALSKARYDDEAAQHAERALTLAESLHDAVLVVDARATLTWLFGRSGVDIDKTRDRYLDLVASSRANGDVHSELRGLHHLAFLHFNAGELVEAERRFRQGMARAEETGRPWGPYGFDTRVFTAVASYLRGHWDEVLALREVGPEVPPLIRGTLDAVALLVTTARGQPADPADLARFREQWSGDLTLAVHSGTAMIELAGRAGDTVAAEEVHDALVDVLTQVWHGTLMPARLRMAALLVGVHCAEVATRTAAESAAIVERMAALDTEIAQVVREWPTLGPEGHAWRQRVTAELARLRWLGGVDPPSAEELEQTWRRCRDAFAGLEDPYEVARCDTRLATVLHALGRPAEADALRRSARATARELGAEPLVTEIDASRGRGTASGLTPREREVLALLSAGRSNAEIGQQLFISTKTASVHVSNILAKLGASGRTEAAAIARRDGIVDG